MKKQVTSKADAKMFLASDSGQSRVVNVSAKEGTDLVSAKDIFRADLGDGLPSSIQLFPPGRHAISAKNGKGEPINLETVITADTAAVIKECFDDMVKAALAGTGPRPYLDFNHEDRDASGWPDDVFWGGDDPKTGGVRAKMTDSAGESTWTKPGSEAISGKSFRAFSPNFQFDRASASVVGTGPNMGGLVNRPAFRQIETLFASEGEDREIQQTKTPAMNKIQQALLAAGLISASATTDEVMAAEFTTAFDRLRGDLKKSKENEIRVVAKESESADALKTVTADNTRLRTKLAEQVVAKAVSEGKIAPKDEAAKARWITVIAKDEENAVLLDAVVAKEDPTKAVTKTPKAGTAPAAGSVVEHPFMVAAKEEARLNHKGDLAAALLVVAAKDGAGYDAYRESLLFVETDGK